MEDWAEIRRLYRAEGVPIKAIARQLNVSRNTVRSAISSDAPPRYERRPAGSAVDMFEPRIRELLAEVPTMPATVIAERIGWTRGITILKERVAELRPVYLPPDPVSSRYERASLIVTSNKPFGRWGEVFGDDIVAAAMIDRLVHHAEIIALKGDSYRLKNRDLGRITPPTATDD